MSFPPSTWTARYGGSSPRPARTASRERMKRHLVMLGNTSAVSARAEVCSGYSAMQARIAGISTGGGTDERPGRKRGVPVPVPVPVSVFMDGWADDFQAVSGDMDGNGNGNGNGYG